MSCIYTVHTHILCAQKESTQYYYHNTCWKTKCPTPMAKMVLPLAWAVRACSAQKGQYYYHMATIGAESDAKSIVRQIYKYLRLSKACITDPSISYNEDDACDLTWTRRCGYHVIHLPWKMHIMYNHALYIGIYSCPCIIIIIMHTGTVWLLHAGSRS